MKEQQDHIDPGLSEVLLRISKAFLGPHDMDSTINECLAIIGRATNAHRAYLFLLRDNGTRMDNTNEWCSKGVEPQKENLQDISPEVVPWWMEKLRNREMINIKDVSDLGEEAVAEKKILSDQNIVSLIVLPLYLKDELMGFIGLDNVSIPGYWKERDISLLWLSADLFTMAISKDREKKKLLESEKRFRVFTEQPLMGIIIIQNNKINYANSAFCRILGYDKHEVYDLSIESLHRVFDEGSKKKFEKNLENVMGKPEYYANESKYTMLTKDGSEKVLRTLSYRIDIDGERSLLAFLIDDSEKEAYQKGLENQKRTAELYLDVLTHDVGNILQGLLTALGLADLKMKESEKEVFPLSEMKCLLNRATNLIRNIKLLSMVRSKEPELRPVELNSIIEEQLERAQSNFPGKNVEVNLRSFDMKTYVNAEPNISEVFFSLFHNAIRFQNHGPPIIDIEINQNSDFSEVKITDHGPGMSRSQKKMLLSGIDKISENKRTGVSLMVVKQLLDRYNGSLDIHDRTSEGRIKGTTFVVSLKSV